jgi:hypothetical protein
MKTLRGRDYFFGMGGECLITKNFKNRRSYMAAYTYNLSCLAVRDRKITVCG